MGNRQVIGLGAVVLGIFLAAGLGIRSAASWLSRSTPTANQDRVLSTGSNRSTDADSALNLVEGDRTRDRSNEQIVGQANNTASTQSLSALEEAGTYIQRQQRVNQDSVIANTPVAAIPTTTSPVASQNNTRVPNQPSASDPGVRSTNPATTAPASTAAPAIADPVPALW